MLLHKQDLDELEKCREKMNEITTRLRNVSTEKDSLSIQNEEYLGQAMEELQQQSEKVVQLTNLKSKNGIIDDYLPYLILFL